MAAAAVAATGASTLAPNPVSKFAPAPQSADVIVIGAGLAGLTAANVCVEHGLKTIVVEASGYIGGRVKTHELLADFPIELGAEFVHGPTNALMSLVKKFGLDSEQIFTWAHGDGGPGPEHPVNGGLAYYWFGRTKKWVRFDADDKEMQAFHQALWDIEELDVSQWAPTDTITDYLRKKGVNPRYFAMADAGYSNTLCNNSSELSIIGAAKLFQGVITCASPSFALFRPLIVIACTLSLSLALSLCPVLCGSLMRTVRVNYVSCRRGSRFSLK